MADHTTYKGVWYGKGIPNNNYKKTLYTCEYFSCAKCHDTVQLGSMQVRCWFIMSNKGTTR